MRVDPLIMIKRYASPPFGLVGRELLGIDRRR